jgi:hypothetical protein
MEIQGFDSSVSRRILIGLLTNSVFVSAVAAAKLSGLFETTAENIIADLAVRYYLDYKRPISTDIGIEVSKQKLSQDQLDNLFSFLASLDIQAGVDNVEDKFLFKIATDFFNERHLRKVVGSVSTMLDRGEVSSATVNLHNFRHIELGVRYGIDPLLDEGAIRAAFEDTSEQLIKFTSKSNNLDDAALFFGDVFSRDNLVSFLAPEKMGKTFMLLDMAWRAVCQRRRVAFFEVGDMSQNQIMLRLMQRVTKRPRRMGYYLFPTKLEIDAKRNVVTDPIQEYFEAGLSVEEAIQGCNDLVLDKGLLRLSVHPNSTVSVVMLESILDVWARENWVPDVIIIDYADLLIPVDSRLEKRFQVDETWRRLRGLSQMRHCLVITATQADAASYKTKILDKSNFSESKTKLAHATGVIGINATPQERDISVRRLNWIVRRECAYNELDLLYIAGSFAVACPMQYSKFTK